MKENRPENRKTEMPSDESIEVQLEKLAKAISSTQEEAPQFESALESETPDLASQILEDQAIAASEAEENKALEEIVEAPVFTVPAHELDIREIQSCMEALLFISDKPLSLEKLQSLLGPTYSYSLFQEAVTALCARYQEVHHGIELVAISGGYQFRTKPGRADLAQKLVKVQTQRLSSGAMESLAIIAYKQPLMKEEVDKIRGVDSSYFIRGLLDKRLIKITGRSELPGKPMLYATTDEFLELFGLKDLASLPSLREIEQMIPGSQSKNPEDEDPRIREMRRLVSQMKADKSSALHYNPKEDEKILKEIRERVMAIPTSTPTLDEMKAAELLAQQQKNEPPVPLDPLVENTQAMKLE